MLAALLLAALAASPARACEFDSGRFESRCLSAETAQPECEEQLADTRAQCREEFERLKATDDEEDAAFKRLQDNYHRLATASERYAQKVHNEAKAQQWTQFSDTMKERAEEVGEWIPPDDDAEGGRRPPALSDGRSPFQARAAVDGQKAADAYRSGDRQAAETIVKAALWRGESDIGLYLVQGMLLRDRGDVPGAMAAAKEALRLDPWSPPALGLVEMLKDPGSAGMKTLNFTAQAKLAAGSPKNEGGDFRPRGGPMGAAPPQGVAGGPPQAAPGRAGATAAAAPARAPLPAPAPRAPVSSPQAKAVQDLMNAGDWKAALLAVTQALQARGEDSQLWRLRALISNKLQNYAAGLSDAGQAVRLAPDDPAALLTRAQSYLALKRWPEALEDARRAAELDPSNALAFLYMAMAEEKLGRLDEARAHYQKAAALDASLAPIADEGLARLSRPAPAPAAPKPALPRWAVPLACLVLAAYPLCKLLGGSRSRPAEAAEETVPVAGPPAAVGPGSVLGGNFELRRELGRGGMGVVYEGFDRTLQRPVAIKRLRSGGDGSTEELERFLREARLVAQLRHPNIVEIHTVVEEAGEAYLVFDLVQGRSLEGLLSQHGRLPPAQVSRLVGELCSALSYAHGRRIVHRDLKPANVMVASDGTCRVMDFGIAHQARSQDLTQTAAWGTPPYMAPEQMAGRVGPESDIFALGVLAYEALAGSRPFPGPDFYGQKTTGRFPPASTAAQELPKALDPVFARALAPDPARRYRGAEEFRQAFQSALGAA